MGDIGIPFLAGILTTLSPCVIPVLPFVSASSLNKSRLGPIALSLGLLLTFVGSSALLALTGHFLGFEKSTLRILGGIGLTISGVLFMNPALMTKLAESFSGLTNKAGQAAAGDYGHPLFSEFLSGALLGIVWSPCSGPSLGAAVSYAGQANSIDRAVGILFVFGLGSVLPLLAFSYGARGLVGRIKTQSNALNFVKKSFGALMLIFGVLIVTNLDHQLEAWLTDLLPTAWLKLITKY